MAIRLNVILKMGNTFSKYKIIKHQPLWLVRCLVVCGSDSPPDCHSLPLLLRIPIVLKREHHPKGGVLSGGDGGIRLAHCGAWSFAALTVHWTVIHYRSYFESLIVKRKNTTRKVVFNFGGDGGIRTLEDVLASYTISNRARSTSYATSPYQATLLL